MDIKKLSEEIRKYSNKIALHPNFLFRGQAKSTWSLEPSFTRLASKRNLDRKKALQLEREIVNKFSISASKLLPLKNTIDLTLARFKSPDGKGLDFMGWFVLMQHYSAPTRKLDWSCSPWAALYFSCYEEEDCDGALWVADFNKVTQYGKEKLGGKDFNALLTDPNAEEILMFSMAYSTNERIEAQQGRFSVCTNPLINHEIILNKCESLVKIEIPKELKSKIMKHLYEMNISAKTLFPGIDGLGRSIHEYCNLWSEDSIIE